MGAVFSGVASSGADWEAGLNTRRLTGKTQSRRKEELAKKLVKRFECCGKGRKHTVVA